MEQWEEWENITTSYNSLKDFYQAEYSNEYESCAEFLLDRWDLGYAEYMNEHDSEDGYIEYAETIYNQVQALFPEEYYVTITYDGNTQTIDLASTSYAEFDLDIDETSINAIDNQNNSDANVTIAYQTFNWAGLNNQPMSLYI